MNRTTNVIIYYQKRKLKYQLISGISILAMGIVIARLDPTSVIYYIWILFGLLQISSWYYKNNYQYLVINKYTITKKSLFPRSLKLRELKAIRKFKSSCILEPNHRKIKIVKDLIENDSLYRLTERLYAFEIKYGQT
ncbi:hypothetical protein DET49_12325 [Salegentibacter sp. 24]|uniref:hypothetical protein n=1 Tax=Salegentibacter sp. 24 TaxID=2183986 RepID=UPI00105B8B29|nr:hypothetical protein [Salegentibacter sp. 24]TDN82761.1 hypothetical protein DET49_12325 [Salegentibacter sp. 24]